MMAEARGKREDQELKNDFNGFMLGKGIPKGNQESRQQISSNQIKVNLKSSNITGLQLADLLAYPFKRGMLLENERIQGDSALHATHRFFEMIKSKSHQTRLLLP